MKNLILLICINIAASGYSQINQNDTTICSGAIINLSVDSGTCLNQVFSQTTNIMTGWTFGPNVNINSTYKILVSGGYSLFGGCQNVTNPAHYTGSCGFTAGTPFNGGPLPVGHWYIHGHVGVRPDNDIFGGTSGVYYYTLSPSSSPLLFSFSDNNYVDNSGTLNFVVNEVIQDSVIWSNGSNSHTISVTPSLTTTYYCTRYLCNQVFFDSVTVFVDSPDTTNIIDTACNEFTWNGNTYTQSGSYSVLLSNILGCDSIVNLDLTINSYPTPPIVYLSNGINLFTDDQANSTYQWILCSDNLIIPNETQSSLIAPFNGVFGVIVTNSCGSDTSDCISIENIGISEITTSIQIYPNPVKEVLSILGLTEFDAYYNIFDLTGRIVMSGNIKTSKNLIDMSFLNQGVYTLGLDGIGSYRIFKE